MTYTRSYLAHRVASARRNLGRVKAEGRKAPALAVMLATEALRLATEDLAMADRIARRDARMRAVATEIRKLTR